MQQERWTRRDALKAGSAAMVAALTQLSRPGFVFPDEAEDEEHVAFLNTPDPRPHMLDWERLDDWITPQNEVFDVSHYGIPEFNQDDFRLTIDGLVDSPRTLTIDDIRSMPSHTEKMTLECSGNGASPTFSGAVYNSEWTGTPLVPILEQCGVQADASEVVFFGVDQREEKIRDVTVPTPFGRSMSLDDVMNEKPLLAYQRNGEPLQLRNGAPLRLIVPGWYGIANVKWLRRIELRDRRYMGRFMGRDYVTIRGERWGDEVVFIETSVARMNLKSVVARVTRRPATPKGLCPVKAYGAVWSDGTPIAKVEVQVDGGDWQEAQLDAEPQAKYCWRFFSIDLGGLEPGKHTVVSRATDADGRVQPTAEDDEIALKKTYWEAYEQWPREFELKA